MKALFKLSGLLALAALLIASCIQEPLVEDPAANASFVQVTVSAGIASEPGTKSEVAIEDGARVLKFTEGDRLYVYGSSQVGGYRNVKGMLTMVENSLTPDGKSAKFTGSLEAYDSNNWISTPNFGDNDPLVGSKATLVHKDMVENEDYDFYNDELSIHPKPAPDVETLMTKSLSVKGNYSSSTKSFALSGGDAIFNTVFTGLAPLTNYNCQLRYSRGEGNGYVTSGNHSFTTDANGMSSHAFCLQNPDSGEHPWEIEIRLNGTTIGTIPLGTRTLEKKIYNVKRNWGNAAFGKYIDISTLTEDFVAQDGDVLSGTLANNVKISIAAGASVWLNGVTIVNTSGTAKKWAGLTCAGDATINLVDGTTNTVHGFYKACPGIYCPKDYTLTINGNTGALTASCYDVETEAAAGIGSGDCPGYRGCGNIIINGGHITAIGSMNAAGIGSAEFCSCGDITINGGYVEASSWDYCPGIGSGCSYSASATLCGDILIAGGTVIATGGGSAPGIGSGLTEGSSSVKSICGTVTITADITSVTAIRGADSPDVIGTAEEKGGDSQCGVIKFGSQSMYDGSAWTNPPTSGSDYGGLHIVISRTNEDKDTWTLTPATQTQ